MPTPEQMERLRAVVPFAQAAQAKWQIPASVSLAQWIFESSWGTSGLTTTCGNCFGIKASQRDRRAPYRTFTTAEYNPGSATPHMEQAAFTAFQSIADCFDAHGRLLATSALYMAAMAVTDDLPAFCRALQSCGYSTNPRYARMLLDEIDSLHLTQYDTAST